MKKAPHVPLSWYSAQGAIVGAVVAALAFWLDRTAMLKVLDGCGADAFDLARLRLFLERSVWQTRRG